MNLFVSWMRTAVPLLVGWVMTAVDVLRLDTDSTAVTSAVTAVTAAAYYTVLRVVEDWAERTDHSTLKMVLGVLLGWATPPHYEEEEKLTLPSDVEGTGTAV